MNPKKICCGILAGWLATCGYAQTNTGGTLLQFDFNGDNPWPYLAAAGAGASLVATNVGTIDVAGSKEPSGGLLLTAGQGTAALTSGLLSVQNSETQLAKLTLSFNLSVAVSQPVTVRIESFDAQKQRSGVLEKIIYPAAPDFYQRYALDLDTMKPVGDGSFNPADPFVSFTFEIKDAVKSQQLRLDNVNYAKPAFYVSTNGSATNDGRTEKSAFATPQQALDVAQPGDIILVGDGIYHANGEQEGVAKFVRPGTPADWIVLKNYPGQHPIFSSVGTWATVKIGNSGTSPAANVTDRPALAYLEIRGLHIRGDADLLTESHKPFIGKKVVHNNSNGISVEGRGQKNPPHHIRAADNIVEYCPGGGISFLHADWVTIENNLVRNNCWWMDYAGSGISINGYNNFDATEGNYKDLIRNNYVSGNRCFVKWAQIGKISDGNGIIIDVNRGHFGRKLIQSNVVFGNGGSGIHAFSSEHVDIINNTAYFNNASPELKWGQIFAGSTTKDIRILNNIMWAQPDKPMNFKLYNKSTNVVYANNIYFGGSTNAGTTGGLGAEGGGNGAEVDGGRNVRADPKFVNASLDYQTADFHLLPGSPALKAGQREPFSPLIDLDVKVRMQNVSPDTGAYEGVKNPDGHARLEFRESPMAASAVAIRGSWSAEPLPLTRGTNGVWTAPVPTLAPGTYEYSVVIDGATNPADNSVRILHVAASGDPQFSAAIPHGAVHVQRYVCNALGTNRECWIYTPPGYEDNNETYPLLVLQHAGADTQKTWVAKGNVDWQLDELIAAGRAKPMVVLMLDGDPHGESAFFKPETRVAAMEHLQSELFDDAIPLVEANYRVETNCELRAFAGPSVGGGQVISIGLSNLDRFAWLGVFSANHDQPEFYQTNLEDAAAVNDKLKLFWISCAQDDKAFPDNEKFVALLDSKGIHHEWHPTPGAHNWPVWRRDLTEYLTRIFQTPSTAIKQ